MKKGQEYTGMVEQVYFPNKGLVLVKDPVDGISHRILVKGVLPGQEVRLKIQKKRRGSFEGRLMEVVTPAPIETRAAECEHFGFCGGCSYQNLPYEEQLRLKEKQVRALLDEVTEDYQFLGIKGSPKEWEYRNKMEFSFGDSFKGGPLTLGFHKKGGMYDIVCASGCTICHEDFTRVLDCVHSYFKEQGSSYHHKITHQGWLRHLLVRRAQKTGEMLIGLVTSSEEQQDLQPVVERLLQLPLDGKIAGILHIENDSLADVVQSDRTEILYGQDYFYEELLGIKFKISAFSFFQTNSLGAELLYDAAREFTGDRKDKYIFDLYSGTGTIAQILAPVAKHVTGVEIVEEAVRAARENARRNGLANCEFIAGDVLKVLDELKDRPDIIVLDPPRDGVHPKALEKILAYQVERIVYISCKPTSLARDLRIILDKGYCLEKALCVDLFPETPNIEVVIMMTYCGLDKKNG